MEFLHLCIDWVLHLDKHLEAVIAAYGTLTYLILFVVLFCETGLVVTPLLPGDSLLFAAGALAARPGSPLNVMVLFILLAIAAVAGDTANYWIGAKVGPKVFADEKLGPFKLKREYLDRTHQFFEKYGGKTIIIARFVPIVRTFAPFVAGIGKMTYGYFISYNVIGGVGWVAALLFCGYLFGGLPTVEHNFSLVVMAIIIISIMPGVYEFLRQRSLGRKKL